MVIVLIIASLIGIIYFYKEIDSMSALIYGIYATVVIIFYVFAVIKI